MATILYIEDNETSRQLVRLILARRSDLELLEATTGERGLSMAFNHRPDVILLDISLPDLHGGEVLRLLRDNPATGQTPVIALSGDAVAHTRHNCPGFQHYLGKPINIEALYTAIDANLSSSTQGTANTTGR